MSRYLVVAHKTGDSPELLQALKKIAEREADAEFELLVPATPMRDLVSDVDEDRREAARRAAVIKQRLVDQGLRATSATAGDANVIDAIRDHLGDHPGYHGLVISTLPPGVSKWLRMDVVRRARRLLGQRVIHVVAESTESEVRPKAAFG